MGFTFFHYNHEFFRIHIVLSLLTLYSMRALPLNTNPHVISAHDMWSCFFEFLRFFPRFLFLYIIAIVNQNPLRVFRVT